MTIFHVGTDFVTNRDETEVQVTFCVAVRSPRGGRVLGVYRDRMPWWLRLAARLRVAVFYVEVADMSPALKARLHELAMHRHTVYARPRAVWDKLG